MDSIGRNSIESPIQGGPYHYIVDQDNIPYDMDICPNPLQYTFTTLIACRRSDRMMMMMVEVSASARETIGFLFE